MTQELRRLAEAEHNAMVFDRVSSGSKKYAELTKPAAILELLDRLEKAEKDAARLDWLEKHDKRYYNYDKIACIVGKGFAHGFIKDGVNSTLRGAIDAAMEASK